MGETRNIFQKMLKNTKATKSSEKMFLRSVTMEITLS